MNRTARTMQFLDKESTLETICIQVANGADLPTMCEGWDIRYSDITQWLYADPKRKVAYENSLRDRGEWMVQKILGEVRKIGTVDIRQAYDEKTGELLPVYKMPEEVARCIQTVTETDTKFGSKTSIKFADKLKALELLGKHLHIFKDTVEHTGALTIEDLVMASFEVKESKPKQLTHPILQLEEVKNGETSNESKSESSEKDKSSTNYESEEESKKDSNSLQNPIGEIGKRK